jgi:phosphomannomutase
MHGPPPTPAFLSYEPVALTFGTSGLRGLVNDITDLEAYINVKGALRYLAKIGDVKPGAKIVLGGDLRPSTDRIMGACARAILDSGGQVENAGKIPTPAVILHSLATGHAGVMVSGSHIPFDRNGIKLNRSVGEILKSDEAGITEEVERVRAEEYVRTADASAFTASGELKAALALPDVDGAAEERYVGRYVRSFGPRALAGLRILVYQHSAVGRDILARILRELGADVVTAGRAETFVPIDTENVTDEMLDRLDALVTAAEEARPFHAVVSTDGDSDRPLVAAALPPSEAGSRGRRVRFLPGDLLGIIVAEHLGADAVAVPISANDAVERRMKERGVLLQKTRIGSPYVVAMLAELGRAGAHARVMGWEANGGFLLGSRLALEEGELSALPTRDATLPIVANLAAAGRRGLSLSALWDELPPRFGRAGLLDQVPVAVSRAILARLVPGGATTEVELEATGRVLDRSRPGEAAVPVDEAAAGAWRDRKSTPARFFSPTFGFDEIVRINVLDGVRVHFRNGDVGHVRPSGNAPQLRIYANSDTQARADEIVAFGLREPDGILRLMERAFA